MYCKVCGKHLYETITFYNLFRLNYNIHYDCLLKFKSSQEQHVFPLLDKIIYYDYLVSVEVLEDPDFLFQKYGEQLLKRVLSLNDISLYIFYENTDSYVTNYEAFLLMLKLGDGNIALFSINREKIF